MTELLTNQLNTDYDNDNLTEHKIKASNGIPFKIKGESVLQLLLNPARQL